MCYAIGRREGTEAVGKIVGVVVCMLHMLKNEMKVIVKKAIIIFFSGESLFIQGHATSL